METSILQYSSFSNELSLYPKKRKHEICTFSYRQSFHVGNAEYLSDFDR